MFKLPAMPEAERHSATGPKQSMWKYRHLVLAAVGIFVYVGAEVSIGSFLINYFTQTNIGNVSEVEAAKYVSFYWLGAMIGRFIGSAVLQKVRTDWVLGVVALVACALVVTSMLTFGHVAMWTIILVGLFNSVMFPNIFTLGIAKLGPLTGDGSGLLVMAIVGGAIIPLLQGALADRIGIHHAFILPAICYLYIAYYAFKGSRPVTVASAAMSARAGSDLHYSAVVSDILHDHGSHHAGHCPGRGVSVVTVSKVLRNKGKISVATRNRVLRRAKELNYQTNWIARSLVTRRTFTIGLLLPDFTHPFFAEIAKAVAETVRPHGYHVIISYFEENPELERSEAESLLARQVDGLILASAQSGAKAFADMQEAESSVGSD